MAARIENSESKTILQLSSTPKELINKLQNDSLNILYAAAYLAIIQTRCVNSGYNSADKPGIRGTLYSTGLYHPNGTERLPNANPKANEFGKHVRGSLYMFQYVRGDNDFFSVPFLE